MCQCASCSLGRASHDARFRQLLWPYDMLVNRVRQACSVHSAKHKRSMFKPCCNPITSQHSLTGGLPPGRTLVVPRTQRRHGSTAARWQKRCDVTCTAPANFAKKASQCPCWSMYRSRRTPSVRSAAAGTPWCWCTSMLFIRERVTSSSRFSPLCSAGGPQGARDLRAERRRRLHSGGDAGAQGAGRPPALRLRRQRPAALQGEHVPLQAHTVVHVRLEGRNQSAGF